MSEQPPGTPPPGAPPPPGDMPPILPPGPPSGPPPGPPSSPPPAYQPPAYQPPPYATAGAATATVTNSKAVVSLIISLVGLITCCLGIVAGPIAFILAGQAEKEIAASGGTQGGQSLAQAGKIIGIIETVLWLGVIVLFFLGVFGSILGSRTTG